MDSDSLLNYIETSRQNYTTEHRTYAAMYYPALLEGWGFTVNLPVSTRSRQFAKSHYHWIITDRYRLVHVIPGSWSTVFVPLPPPIWPCNFLGTYTMMQTHKLIWLKNNFFHWATSSLTSVHWSVTALDKQLCRSQEVARTNGLRWLLPRRCVQDHSLKLGFIESNINKKRETFKKFNSYFSATIQLVKQSDCYIILP